MFNTETIGQISAFKAKKQAQWERVAPVVVTDEGKPKLVGMPLQLVTFGDRGSKFMLTYSAPHFYESIIFGQLPEVVLEAGPRGMLVAIPESQKPLESRGIDLSDGELDAVLAAWVQRRSALTLPFITTVWGSDGKERVKH